MLKTKVTFFVCLFGSLFLSVCSSQSAKSQPTSSETKSASARSFTSSTDPNSYMNTVLAPGRIDLIQLLPILILIAFIPFVLPLITQLFAGLLTPLNFTHGRRRRDANLHKNPQISNLLLDLIKKVGESIDKYKD